MADGKSGNGLVKGVTVCGVVIPMILIAPIVLLMSFSTILVAMVQAQYGTTCGSTTSSSNTTTSWVEWAKNIAADDSHGYSQPRRNGNPDYDCSSLVYYALKQAGLDVGSSAFSTANEGTVLEKAGFERHDWTKVSDLQSGDIVWRSSHTEIYVGDGKFVGAHHDENGGITGPKAGDQTGDEISVDSYAVGYTAYYRYKGAMNVETADGKVTSAQAVSGKTKDDGWDGMSSAAAKTKWFNGLAGPGDACATYPEGQCTWGACVRAYHLGWKHVGKYWGNGQNWAASARSEGYGTTTDAPVPGAIVSFPAGIEGADATYGHVAVVENVDTARGTILISEMNVKGPVYSSRTLPIKGGAVYILPKDSISGAGGGSVGTDQCVTGDDSTSDVSGDKASVEAAKKIAKRGLKDYGWEDGQFDCLDKLWTRESGWRWDAENPSSGAYGIPQSLPGSKMASAGQDWKTNAATQIKWGLGYIQQRYQSPCGAWAHSETTGWY